MEEGSGKPAGTGTTAGADPAREGSPDDLFRRKVCALWPVFEGAYTLLVQSDYGSSREERLQAFSGASGLFAYFREEMEKALEEVGRKP